MQLWIRFAFLFGATAAYLVAHDFHAVWWQVFLVALGASLAGHVVWTSVRRSRRAQIAIGIVAGLAAAVAVVFAIEMKRPSVVYLHELDEIAGKPPIGERLRVRGYVVAGSMTRSGDVIEFGLHEESRVTVRYQGVLPDTFRDGMEVVAEGRFSAKDRFEAAQVLVKCPSNYDRSAGPRPF